MQLSHHQTASRQLKRAKKKGKNYNLNFRAKNSFLIFTKYLKSEVKLHFFLKKIRAFTAFTLNLENHNKDKKKREIQIFSFYL